MIEVSVTCALLFYLGILLLFIFGVWMKNHLSSRKKKTIPSAQSLTICEYCHSPFLSSTLKQIAKCPHCHLLNKK